MTHPGNVAVEERRDSGRPVPAGASIRVTHGFYEGLEVPLERDWMVIGRGRGADVVIAESTISRAHVAIGFDEEGFFMQDLGSRNGTWVNGRPEPRARLSDGDQLQLGKLQLQLSLPAGENSGEHGGT